MLELILHIEFLVHCIVALALGSLIGLERELKNKPAGLKTHVLICVGACAITFLSQQFGWGGDPGRIAAQIVSGIGFIGGGTILQSRRVVQGLTTAATLWIVASIGMLVGAGFTIAATGLTILIVIFLYIARLFTKKWAAYTHYALNVEILKPSTIEKIEDMLDKFDITVHHKTMTRSEVIQLELQYQTTSLNNHLFLKSLYRLSGVGTVIKI